MSPPRFRIRTLMIAVAVAAICLGGCALWKRAGEHRSRAQKAAEREQLARQREVLYRRLYLLSKDASLRHARTAAKIARVEERSGRRPFDSSERGSPTWVARALGTAAEAVSYRDKAREAAKEAERYAKLRAIYEQAACRPWLPVPPDPPEPK